MIKLSVAIATYDRNDVLAIALTALENQSCSKDSYEVIVVDDGSPYKACQKTKDMVTNLDMQVRFISQAHKGPAAAWNSGIKAARGEIVLIINNDTIATPRLLAQHIQFHRLHTDENIAMLGFITWSPKLKVTPFDYWLEHGGPHLNYGQISGNEAKWWHFWNCNISLKRNFLLANGLYDEGFLYPAWLDVEMGYRLSLKNLKLVYDKTAIAYHYHSTGIESSKQRMIYYGKGAVWMFQKMPAADVPPLVRPYYRKVFQFLDTIILCKPLLFILEKIAYWAESRVKLGIVFTALMAHYRIKGIKEECQRLKVEQRS